MTSNTMLSDIMVLNNKKRSWSRSALGVGVTTLVTILVVLLMASFAVLSLVTARSDLALSDSAITSVTDYYKADAAATQWYAELDSFCSRLTGTVSDYQAMLEATGYATVLTADGEIRVTQDFAMGETRHLIVTVAIERDKTTTIRQWQT
ncbi:MAG: hypothetical protein LBC35_00870 [Coriobacteriales bacterium]|jgi:hypothetical protein|nr:hypothetical protein [Coriobacteriales bacterium]